MFRWQKLGRIFGPAEFTRIAWMAQFAQAPATLVFKDFVRVYFSCRAKPDENGQYVSRCAYVDLSRDNLFNVLGVSQKPVLELGDVGAFDEFGTYPMSVLADGGHIHAYYGGWTRCESVPFNVAIGYGRSDDGGATFKKLGKGPILSYAPDEPFIVGGPKIRKYGETWYLWYIAGRQWIRADGKPEPVYKIRMATSTDGLAWTRVNRDLISDNLGEDEAQACPDVSYANGKYHMFFCYRQSSDFRRNKKRSYRIGYASSVNLTKWTRDDSRVGIDVAEEGWDSEMVAYPHILQLEGVVYLLYLGNEVGRFGFGAARLDGILE